MNALEDRIRDAYSAADSWGPTVPPPLRRPARRRWPRLAPPLAAATTVALIAAGIAYAVPDDRTPRRSVPVTMPRAADADISIFLCARTSTNPACGRRDATAAQRAAVAQALRELPGVRAVLYESKERAFASFKEQFGKEGLGRKARPGDIPDSFRVTVRRAADIPVISRAIVARPGVDQVMAEP